MKILHFTHSLRPGGSERQIVECLKGLSTRKGVICELAIMGYNIHYTAVNDLNIKIHYLNRRIKKDPTILIKLYKICKQFMPDIIHTWDSMTSVYAFPVAKMLKIKFINGMIRDAFTKGGKFWIRSKLTFPFSDVILSNSYAGLRSSRAPSNRGIFIHNGFDFGRTKNLQDKKLLKKDLKLSGYKVAGMVASFSNKKDYKTLIEAAQRVLTKRNDVAFLTIGDGEKLEECEKLVKPEFRDRLRFLGKQEDVESIINIFDIGILATDTRFHAEGISNAIMEYMALGKPVVATDSGGVKELVINGKTGFIVRPLDPKDMFINIIQLLENEKLAIKMGKAGRQRIYSNFGLEKMTNSFINLYESILNTDFHATNFQKPK